MGMRKVLYILGHLNDEDVEWMARAGRRVAASGHELIRENEPSDDLYFVLEGEVTVITHDGEATLGKYDSCYLAPNESRAIENRTHSPASMLVAIPYPEPRDV